MRKGGERRLGQTVIHGVRVIAGEVDGVFECDMG